MLLPWVWVERRLFDRDSGTEAGAEVPKSRSNNRSEIRTQGNQILISRDLLSQVSSKKYDDDTFKKVRREVWQM